jgi:hypothetical protein
MMSDVPIQATRKDLAENARRHYEFVSKEASDYLTTIPNAIDAWEREPALEAQLAALTAENEELEKENSEQSQALVSNATWILGYQKQLKECEAERDRLWCEALVATGDTELMERVTKTFNQLRDERGIK